MHDAVRLNEVGQWFHSKTFLGYLVPCLIVHQICTPVSFLRLIHIDNLSISYWKLKNSSFSIVLAWPSLVDTIDNLSRHVRWWSPSRTRLSWWFWTCLGRRKTSRVKRTTWNFWKCSWKDSNACFSCAAEGERLSPSIPKSRRALELIRNQTKKTVCKVFIEYSRVHVGACISHHRTLGRRVGNFFIYSRFHSYVLHSSFYTETFQLFFFFFLVLICFPFRFRFVPVLHPRELTICCRIAALFLPLGVLFVIIVLYFVSSWTKADVLATITRRDGSCVSLNAAMFFSWKQRGR